MAEELPRGPASSPACRGSRPPSIAPLTQVTVIVREDRACFHFMLKKELRENQSALFVYSSLSWKMLRKKSRNIISCRERSGKPFFFITNLAHTADSHNLYPPLRTNSSQTVLWWRNVRPSAIKPYLQLSYLYRSSSLRIQRAPYGCIQFITSHSFLIVPAILQAFIPFVRRMFLWLCQ